MDVIILDNIKLDFTPSPDSNLYPKTFQFYEDNKQIKSWYKSLDNIIEFMRCNPDVNYRYFIEPQEQLLPAYEIIQFGPKYTLPMIEKGKEEAKKVVEMGPGVSFEALK